MKTIPEQSRLPEAVLEVVPLLARTLSQRLRLIRFELAPPHYNLLRMLSCRPFMQHELGEMIHVGPSTLSATLETLVRRGWITREHPPEDRRKVRLLLTPKGLEVLDEVQQASLAQLNDVLSPLTPEEQQTILEGIELLTKTLLNNNETIGAEDFFPPMKSRNHPSL